MPPAEYSRLALSAQINTVLANIWAISVPAAGVDPVSDLAVSSSHEEEQNHELETQTHSGRHAHSKKKKKKKKMLRRKGMQVQRICSKL